jgi:metallo-beta-lactamase class B
MATLTRIIAFLVYLSPLFCQAQGDKLTITHLTGDFFVFTTWRMLGDIRFPANGLYLVTNQGVVMIDTPWDTTQFQPLLDSIEVKHKKSVVLCIATHSHEDRTAGLEFLGNKGIKTYTSSLTDEICIDLELEDIRFKHSTVVKVTQRTTLLYGVMKERFCTVAV